MIRRSICNDAIKTRQFLLPHFLFPFGISRLDLTSKSSVFLAPRVIARLFSSRRGFSVQVTCLIFSMNLTLIGYYVCILHRYVFLTVVNHGMLILSSEMKLLKCGMKPRMFISSSSGMVRQ
ncbi:hypothetical protein BT93_A1317 [Corymbia citriodora subsp. variegata]|nr:hypothetical protein BT93_A1317 [Corymbia citriodora subsp. variegata]